MSRYLMVDIGAGTMDVLYFDDQSGVHYKAVAKSPVLLVAEQAAKLPGNLLASGCEMGGGAISQVLIQRAREADVVMTAAASMTIHHDLDRVRAQGIRIIDDQEAESLRTDYQCLDLGDLDLERLKQIIEGIGVPFEFDVMGLCAQDHGMPPPGISHLDYRHNLFKARLDASPLPHSLLFPADRVPATFNRLSKLANRAAALPVQEVYVMDSGMAAILGASMDALAKDKDRILVLDIATSHTVGAALQHQEIIGFFEYHTHDLTLERLEDLLRDLGDGKLDHQQVLQEGGHGAYARSAFGFSNAQIIIATGPKRQLAARSRLPIAFGAPWGDNMMTGTVGLLEAIRRWKGMQPILYL
ncbi:MAG TPA: pyruvate formate-lyase activating enzyme [Syntrophobacteraceae bacterium]|nr:pyruvate formate-lyase activating enzyme [Syntrophobacteraceae bacterium]